MCNGRIHSVMPTLPNIAWSEGVPALLPEPAAERTSAEAVCTALHKAAEDKDAKAAAMSGIGDLAAWAKDASAYWIEPYLIPLLPTVLALCADKARAVQLVAEQAGVALMGALNPVAVDGVLPLLFAEFDAHRWQTKLAAVQMLTAMAKASPRTVACSLPALVAKLMEVAQDPKPAIKEAATVALKECCSVISNADVIPLIDDVIAANMDPEALSESCLDKLVATTFVASVDEPTLSIIVPVLMRGLRVRGNAAMVRKAAVVCDTMFKLVNDPADIAAFAPDLMVELSRNAEEVAISEVRQKVAEAINTVTVSRGEYDAKKVDCSAAEVAALLRGCLVELGAAAPDAVVSWIAQVTAPLFASGRPRPSQTVAPYLLLCLAEQQANLAAEKFLSAGSAQFGAEEEGEDEEDHDQLEVLCNCSFSLAYGNRVLLHNTPLKLKRGKCYGLIGPNGAGKSTLMRSIAADNVEGFPKEIRSVYVECDVSVTDADISCVDFAARVSSLQGKDKKEVADMLASVGFSEGLMWAPVGSLSGGWRMRLALSKAMLQAPGLPSDPPSDPPSDLSPPRPPTLRKLSSCVIQ